MSNAPPPARALPPSARALALTTAFLGWFCAGVMMSITQLAMQPAAVDLLARGGDLDLARYTALNRIAPKALDGPTPAAMTADDVEQLKAWRALTQKWFAYFQCALLFGAATGGFLLGRFGDRVGRVKAMGASILCYSLVPVAAYFAQTPFQLLACWFLACLGVGGMWPNGVALVSECWSNLSRPATAGIIGTSANIGIFGMATLAAVKPVTSADWRWVMLVAAAPVVLGVLVLLAVPESPRWLAARSSGPTSDAPPRVFRPPLLWVVLVGVLLATVPSIGGWGSTSWMIPWADAAGQALTPPDPSLKAHVAQARALTGIVGSLLGGWIASTVGRRRTYFLTSLAALGCAQYTFWVLTPTDRTFLIWVGALGFFSGIFFGWLPLVLPELFPTRVRSTGAGVSFNFARIVTALTVFLTAALTEFFAGDYAGIGRVTSLIYAVGLVAIWLAPDTTRRQLED